MIDAQVVQKLNTADLKFLFAIILLLRAAQDIGGYVTVEAAGKAA